MSRIMLYDNTEPSGWLTRSWAFGAQLYRTFRALDLVYPVYSWHEALQIIVDSGANEIQFWGHGSPGAAYIGDDVLRRNDIAAGGKHHKAVMRMRSLPDIPTLWFRTCATLNGPKGKEFSQELSNSAMCRVAGHTYNIGPFQSGLHTLSPSESPYWPDDEGLGKSGELLGSAPWHKNTINCLVGNIPGGW